MWAEPARRVSAICGESRRPGPAEWLRIGERPEIDCEPVVLGRDLDEPVGEAAHGMVATVMTERELVGAGAEGRPNTW